MTAVLIGIFAGFLVIVFIGLLKALNKQIIYGLILAGIAFLYVGFTWSDLQSLVVNSFQAIGFLFLAYFGIKKSLYFLISGYFLHGSWDLLYNLFPKANLIPPHYDLFCLSIDFTIGFYLLFINYNRKSELKEDIQDKSKWL